MTWDKTITLYAKWGVGGTSFLVAPNGGHPEFKLTPIKDRSGNPTGAHSLSFVDGCMHTCWSTCTPLKEIGTDAPPPIGVLPPLDETDPQLDQKYQKALMPLLDDLSTRDSKTIRIEGNVTVPFPSQGKQTLDRVRMVYLVGVAPVPGGSMSDLVVVVLDFDSGLEENGGATGPPH
jgi:hypothetical protein